MRIDSGIGARAALAVAWAVAAGGSQEAPAPGAALEQGSAPRAALASERILEGLGRDDHLGHALDAAARIVADGPRLLAVGGGSKWDESRAERNHKRDTLALFPVEDAGGPRLSIESTRGGDRFAFDLTWAPGLLGAPGVADLAVGAPRGPVIKVDGDAQPAERGAVYLFSAADLAAAEDGADLSAATATLILVGKVDGERFGFCVDAVGDLDGDGLGDLVVGAPGGPRAPELPGRVLLFSGAKLRAALESGRRRRGIDDPELGAVVLATGAPGDRLGTSVAALAAARGGPLVAAGAPQVDFDSELGELVARGGTGLGYAVAIGPAAGGDEAVVGRWPGAEPLGDFGRALCWVATAERDPLLAIGAPRGAGGDGSQAGRVTLASTAAARRTWDVPGARDGDRFGWALVASEDGRWLAVGSPNDSLQLDGESVEVGFRRGSVTVFALGAEGRASPAALFYGEESRDHLGYALAPAAGSGRFWAGAVAWPGAAGTELGRVYRVEAAP